LSNLQSFTSNHKPLDWTSDTFVRNPTPYTLNPKSLHPEPRHDCSACRYSTLYVSAAAAAAASARGLPCWLSACWLSAPGESYGLLQFSEMLT